MRSWFTLPLAFALSMGHAHASPCANIVIDGDSVAGGAGATQDHKPQVLIQAALGPLAMVRSVAVGGRPAYQNAALFNERVAPLYNATAAVNIIALHSGDNDINQGKSAEEAYRSVTAYVTEAHRQGWRVIVSTDMMRKNFPPAKEANIEAFNRLIVSNASRADAVVDLSRRPTLYQLKGRAESGLYSPDLVHPNNAGYAVLVTMLMEPIQQMVGAACR